MAEDGLTEFVLSIDRAINLNDTGRSLATTRIRYGRIVVQIG
jgi:hypothetical protein